MVVGMAPGARISRLIEQRGPITFARFMLEALYGPGGYYQSSTPVGRDFHTSPRVSPLFGKLMAEAVRRVGGDVTTLVEFGAGSGHLAAPMLSALSGHLRYFGIEPGASARSELRVRLRPFGRRAKVCVKFPDRIFRGTGIVIANELFDALPCHRVVGTSAGLAELYVGRSRDGRFVEVRGKPSTSKLERQLRAEGIRLRRGQKAEVCLEAAGVYRAVGRAFRRCVLIAVDYGYEAEELYSPLRHGGTIRGYFRHRESDDLLAGPGEQDMTYHVDLTHLRLTASRYGFGTQWSISQGRFLLGLGALELMRGVTMEERLSLKTLLMPGGMGDRFTVLVQVKGMSLSPSWCPSVEELAAKEEG